MMVAIPLTDVPVFFCTIDIDEEMRLVVRGIHNLVAIVGLIDDDRVAGDIGYDSAQASRTIDVFQVRNGQGKTRVHQTDPEGRAD